MKRPRQLARIASALSRRLTKHEVVFMRRLTLANIASFDFQVQIGFYVADFVFPEKMLIIELDGASHDERKEYDQRRDAFLSTAGFTVWRILNKDAGKWPLEKIVKYGRPAVGRGYVDALAWAMSKAESSQFNAPPVVPTVLKIHARPKHGNIDFYTRLAKKVK